MLQTAVAGVSTNIVINCDHNIKDVYIWVINDLVYGALQVPMEYTVCGSGNCDLSTLTIPVPLSEMDGTTFQCVSIDYHTNTILLDTKVQLVVTTIPGLETHNTSE